MMLRNLYLRFILVVVVILSIKSVTAQNAINAFYIGHSLSDQIPDMVKSLSDDTQGISFDWSYQWIPGAPLRWQWNNGTDYSKIDTFYSGYNDRQFGLPTGKFNVLVLTESVPRYSAIIDETYDYAGRFYEYANSYNPDIQVYLYEVWHCIKSGTPTGCDYDVNSSNWRQRLKDDLPMWESVVDYLNEKYNPNSPVCLIPAGQGLATLYDSIQVGVIPGISNMEQLFEDDIHLNNLGKYFIACIHYAAIHRISPVGRTNQLRVWWGGDFSPIPSPTLAKKMQEIAWETVNRYPKSCLSNVISSTEIEHKPAWSIHPNPTQSVLYFSEQTKNTTYSIYNTLGQLLWKGNDTMINVSDLPKGCYFIHANNLVQSFVKQ